MVATSRQAACPVDPTDARRSGRHTDCHFPVPRLWVFGPKSGMRPAGPARHLFQHLQRSHIMTKLCTTLTLVSAAALAAVVSLSSAQSTTSGTTAAPGSARADQNQPNGPTTTESTTPTNQNMTAQPTAQDTQVSPNNSNNANPPT